ncbi:hypothetical protein AALP_AA7G124400 [Arabis alpina]|uniref:Bifunctional inhibitor/plant lipid transfer protein/seed storage helical domain-containing protein n=1 Tax=Arabis alpina TaxID=50452 RepID=A0A087GHL1_ARAAL|nr:hypothetical protein AALP_AA7G124400 [Arabis alpina]
MHRAILLMTLITSAVSRNEEEQCRDMFESFVEGISQQPSPQYCRGVSHFNNVLKLTSPISLHELKKKKPEIGRRCECLELEVIWRIKCVPCAPVPDFNVSEYESYVNVL